MVHEPTVKLMQEHYARSGKEVNEARLRMATLPQDAEVNEAQTSKVTRLLILKSLNQSEPERANQL